MLRALLAAHLHRGKEDPELEMNYLPVVTILIICILIICITFYRSSEHTTRVILFPQRL